MHMWQGEIDEGMTVFSADGHKLGKVIRVGSDDLVIEKGLFFPRDYLVRYAEVAAVEGDQVRLVSDRDVLVRLEQPVELDETRRDFQANAGVPPSATAPTTDEEIESGTRPVARQPERPGKLPQT